MKPSASAVTKSEMSAQEESVSVAVDSSMVANHTSILQKFMGAVLLALAGIVATTKIRQLLNREAKAKLNLHGRLSEPRIINIIVPHRCVPSGLTWLCKSPADRRFAEYMRG
jgi:hypothetical protein